MKSRIFLWGEEARFANYRRALEVAGAQAVFSAQPDDAAGCDGLLLAGGADLDPARYGQKNTASLGIDPLRDEAELRLLDCFTAARKPVFGVCRGLQVINVFFGGTLLQDICGHEATEQGDLLHNTRANRSFLSALYGSSFVVNSAHHQAVDRLGSGLELIQWADDGTVEGLCHRTLPVFAVQWHPERLTGKYSRPGAVDGDAVFHYFLSKLR